MTAEPLGLFNEFWALTNPNLFNIALNALETLKVRDWYNTTIQELVSDIYHCVDDDKENANAGTFLKLFCEIAAYTGTSEFCRVYRNMMIFAAYQGCFIDKDQSVSFFDNPVTPEVIDKDIKRWILEFARIINPKQIPNLITELEKIGFERS
jgi:hypothetical protein